MNNDEKQGVVLVIGVLLAYVYYKTGIYRWDIIDILGLTAVIVGLPFFLYLFLRRNR